MPFEAATGASVDILACTMMWINLDGISRAEENLRFVTATHGCHLAIKENGEMSDRAIGR